MKNTNTLIPYGLRGDNCIHITELEKHESGLSCNCTCPSCGEKLIAKSLSGKYQAHFAHSRLTNCNTAAESGLHLKAKEIIKNTRCVSAPPLDAKISHKVEFICREKTIHICRVPDDRISQRSYPLLASRELIKQLIQEKLHGHQAA